MTRIVVVLDTMWGDRTGNSPRYFRINPQNKTGSVLCRWLGEQWDGTVTNACPELVDNASKHGKPNRYWLNENLKRLRPIELAVVCGKTAQAVFPVGPWAAKRTVFVPHPAARMWTRIAYQQAQEFIQCSALSLKLVLSAGRIRAYRLHYPELPF